MTASTHQPRHHLGGYEEYAPPPSLAAVSEAVWWHATPPNAVLAPGSAHRVLPDPSLSLACMCRRDERGYPHNARVIVIGPVVAPRRYALLAGQELAAVKLKLEWAGPLLGIGPTDHADAMPDLYRLDDGMAARLHARLLTTRCAADAVAVLADVVAERARAAPAQGALACRALDLLRRTGGRPEVARLAAHLATSERHLRRVVRDAAGVSLKSYARTRRFLHAVLSADRLRRPRWARLAAETGYCDQSHLARDFRALAGLPPVRLLRERRAESDLSKSGRPR